MKKLISRYKLSIKNIGVYFLASLIPMILSIMINPLVALNMEPEDYGTVGYFNSFSTLVSPLVMFFMLHYYQKRYFEIDEKDRIELKSIIFKSLIGFSFLLTIISFFGIYTYSVFFNQNSKIPFFPYAIIYCLSLPLLGIYSLMLSDFKMKKDSSSFFKLSVGNGIMGVFLTLLFVVILKKGALGRMTATLIANSIVFLWVLIANRDLLKIKFDRRVFISMIKFCWPLTLAAMLGFFSAGYDRVLLERLGDVSELGYYVVGVQMAGYIGVFTAAITSTFQPDIYEGVVKRNWRKTGKYISLIVGVTSIVVLAFILFAPLMINILTAGRYTYSAKYLRILALAQITSVLYYSISQVTIVLGATKITLFNRIIGSLLIIVMFSLLITRWGFVGAAWGQVVSFVIFMLGNLLLVIIWKRKRIQKILGF